MSCFFVYILECKDGSLYSGYTNDLQKRLSLHNSGQASKYTRSRLPAKFAASWKFSSKSEAMKFEARLKRMSRKDKLDAVKTARLQDK